MAQPGEPLQVGVEDEAERPGSATATRVIGASCETATRNTISEPTAKATTFVRESRPAGISRRAVRGLRASIDGVDQAVQRHRQAAGAGHRDGDPQHLPRRGHPAQGEDGAGVGVGQREHRVLELDQADEPAGVDGGRAQCAVGRSSSSRSPCSSAGAMASKSSAHAFGLPGMFTISGAAADAAAAAREHPVRRDGDRHRPHVLVEAGRGPLDHLGGRLGGDVAGREAGAARGQHQVGRRRPGRAARRRSRPARRRRPAAPRARSPAPRRRSSRTSPLRSSRVPATTPSETVSTAAITRPHASSGRSCRRTSRSARRCGSRWPGRGPWSCRRRSARPPRRRSAPPSRPRSGRSSRPPR